MEFIPSPHHSSRTKAITAIVLHYTASLNIEGTISWFQRPESRVSAHYLIGRDGRTIQMVRDSEVAWHAGRSAMPATGEPNVNSFSLGIELVGTADSGFTDVQMAALYTLLEALIPKYNILPERVVGHCHVSPGRKIDPDGHIGQMNWVRVRQVAQRAYEGFTASSNLTASGEAYVGIDVGGIVDKLISENGRFDLLQQNDGNLVTYDRATGEVVWDSASGLYRPPDLSIPWPPAPEHPDPLPGGSV